MMAASQNKNEPLDELVEQLRAIEPRDVSPRFVEKTVARLEAASVKTVSMKTVPVRAERQPQKPLIVLIVCLLLAVSAVGIGLQKTGEPVERQTVHQNTAHQQKSIPSHLLATHWKISPVGRPVFRVIAPDHILLERGEIELCSLTKTVSELCVTTPSGTVSTTDSHCFVGVHSLENDARSTNYSRSAEPLLVPSHNKSQRDQNGQRDKKGKGTSDMKRFSLTRVLVLAGIVTLSNVMGNVTGAESSLLAAEKGQSPVKAVVKTNSDFAINLYQQLVKENKGTNLFFSPYSISSALMMTAEGARGKTAQEMGDVLCFPKNAQRLGPGSQQIPWRTGLMHTGMGKIQDEINNEQKYDSPAQQKLLKELRALEKQLAGQSQESPKERAKRIRDPKFLKEIFRLTELEGKLASKWAATKDKSARLELLKKMQELSRKRSEFAGCSNRKCQVIEDKIYALKVKLNYYESRTVNSLWGEQTFPFSKNYLKTINGSYKTGGLFLADFKGKPEAERLRINKWVEEQTKNRIKGLIPPGAVGSDTRLALVNAIYFKAAWKTPFKDSNDRPFTLSNGKKITAPLMRNMFVKLPYYVGKGFKMVEMPYIGRYSMVAIVPDAANGLPALEAKLTSENLSKWIGQLKGKHLDIQFPKFKLETDYTLNGTLQTMGMPTAFGKGADFSGLSERSTSPLYITLVKHKAFIDVTKKGTEAAAATVVLVGGMSAPLRGEKLSVDRPFVYLIRDTKTGSITFMGRMMNPTAK